MIERGEFTLVLRWILSCRFVAMRFGVGTSSASLGGHVELFMSLRLWFCGIARTILREADIWGRREVQMISGVGEAVSKGLTSSFG